MILIFRNVTPSIFRLVLFSIYFHFLRFFRFLYLISLHCLLSLSTSFSPHLPSFPSSPLFSYLIFPSKFFKYSLLAVSIPLTFPFPLFSPLFLIFPSTLPIFWFHFSFFPFLSSSPYSIFIKSSSPLFLPSPLFPLLLSLTLLSPLFSPNFYYLPPSFISPSLRLSPLYFPSA